MTDTSTYELTYLLRSEEDVSLLRTTLGKYEVRVLQERPLSKVQLEYPIGGERYAFLGILTFEVPVANLHSLRSSLQLQDGVLRSLITLPIPTHGAASEEKLPEERIPLGEDSRVFSRPTPERRPARDTLSNEALERKIEEILE